MTPPRPPRHWAGTTLEARQAQRRARLVDAGIELLGTEGAAGVTVRAACRSAKLTERYFYESFTGREDLLRAVHAQVAGEARDVIVDVIRARPARAAADEALAADAVAAFTAFLDADRRRARVLLSESLTDAVLARHEIELLPAFAALLAEQIGALPADRRPDATDARLTSVALIGALRVLYLQWLEGGGELTTERLNRHATALIVAAASVSSRGS